jgi:hypothetical protein
MRGSPPQAPDVPPPPPPGPTLGSVPPLESPPSPRPPPPGPPAAGLPPRLPPVDPPPSPPPLPSLDPDPLEAVEVEVVAAEPPDTDPPVFPVRPPASVVGVAGGFLCGWSRSGQAKRQAKSGVPISIWFKLRRATRPLSRPDGLGTVCRVMPSRRVEEELSPTNRYARKRLRTTRPATAAMANRRIIPLPNPVLGTRRGHRWSRDSKQGSRSRLEPPSSPAWSAQRRANPILRPRSEVWISAVRLESKAGGSGTLVRLT